MSRLLSLCVCGHVAERWSASWPAFLLLYACFPAAPAFGAKHQARLVPGWSEGLNL
ncbi:MAG: hypothetical protein M0P40_09455 [Bacteroidales bacterium]|nr:hypothetical protein [Bacteroidales bacterium]